MPARTPIAIAIIVAAALLTLFIVANIGIFVDGTLIGSDENIDFIAGTGTTISAVADPADNVVRVTFENTLSVPPIDITDVGPGCATGACLTDGVVSTGTTLFIWEGTTDDGFDIIFTITSDPATSSVFNFEAVADHEWSPITGDFTIGDGDEGQIRLGSLTIGKANDTISTTVTDGIAFFYNDTASLAEDISFIFLGPAGIPRFVLADEGPDLATYNPRSLLIGPAASFANVDENIICSTNFVVIDCDTAGSGADLGVQDDVEIGGSLFLTTGTTIELSSSATEFLIDGPGELQFQEATTITTLAGALTLSPVGSIDFAGNTVVDVVRISGTNASGLNLFANQTLTAGTARSLQIETLDTGGNARVVVAKAVPTATETTPFWAQRGDITTPLTGTLDASFLTFEWDPTNDEVSVFVNDGGTIRSGSLGIVNTVEDMILSPTNDIVIGADVFIEHDVNSGIVASTTQSQGAGPLTTEINEISVVGTTNDVVTLPAAATGRRVLIINNSTNTVQVFPASGDNLGAGINISGELEANEAAEVVAYNDTNWRVSASTETRHAEMVDFDNTDAYGISVANNAHVYHTNGTTASDLAGYTFDAGGAGTSVAVASIADGGGGEIAVTTGAAHGLAVDDIISISNTGDANYDTVFIVNTITSGTIFEVTATFGATATGTMDQAAILRANTGSAGSYLINWAASATSATNNEVFDFAIYIGATRQNTTNVRRKFGTAGDIGSLSGVSIIDVASLDKISFMITNTDSAGDITIRNLAIVLTRL